MSPHVMTWLTAGLATARVIVRPLDWPEAIWAVSGAVLLVLPRLLAPADALAGVARGKDAYLSLVGMMPATPMHRMYRAKRCP
jgi:arsenical pump membrane protein